MKRPSDLILYLGFIAMVAGIVLYVYNEKPNVAAILLLTSCVLFGVYAFSGVIGVKKKMKEMSLINNLPFPKRRFLCLAVIVVTPLTMIIGIIIRLVFFYQVGRIMQYGSAVLLFASTLYLFISSRKTKQLS